MASVTPTKKAVGTGKAAVADAGGVSTTGGTCRVQRLPDKAAVPRPSTVSEKLQAAAAAGADSAKDVEGIVLAAADVDMAVINTAAAGEVQLQDGGCSVDVAAPQDRDGDVALMVLQRAQAQMAEAEAAAETEAFA